jgi:hypothetical protein
MGNARFPHFSQNIKTPFWHDVAPASDMGGVMSPLPVCRSRRDSSRSRTGFYAETIALEYGIVTISVADWLTESKAAV